MELVNLNCKIALNIKQLQTYLKLTGCKLGYLLNFNERLLKNGIVRCVNQLEK
ncbi:MAG: GxxExxY protein [Pseudomonadota bacterium]|nr:GxxExxY protein [Pseudomonadota bacterium]